MEFSIPTHSHYIHFVRGLQKRKSLQGCFCESGKIISIMAWKPNDIRWIRTGYQPYWKIVRRIALGQFSISNKRKIQKIITMFVSAGLRTKKIGINLHCTNGRKLSIIRCDKKKTFAQSFNTLRCKYSFMLNFVLVNNLFN